MKTIIITGANSGLGFETAQKIAYNAKYKVILACRSDEKAEAAKERIVSETGNENIVAMHLDTSSLKSVRAFAEEVIASGEKVDALVNNAGISSLHSGTTEDGFELVFATNYLGHFLLTHLLLPQMAEDARIINVSSDMHEPPSGLEWPGMEAVAHPKKDDPKRYSYSKLCSIYFTYELDWRLRNRRSFITVNAFNPGMMSETNFGPKRSAGETGEIKKLFADRVGDLETSSEALAQLVTSAEAGGISGKYFDRSTKHTHSSPLSYSTGYALEMWEKSMEYCGLEQEPDIEGYGYE